MRIHALLLDNSTGPWHQMYQKGAMKTWGSGVNRDLVTNLYMGQKPKVKGLNATYNRILISRHTQKFWRYLQTRTNSRLIQCRETTGIIQVGVPETWPNITLKTMAAIRYVDTHFNFDFLIRGNASCYVNVSTLMPYLESQEGPYLYAGPKAPNKAFISGWGIVLNKKAVEMLLGSENPTYLNLFDDEAIGQMLKSVGIEPISIPYLEITSAQELDTKTKSELQSFPFIRVKATQKGKRVDDVLMGKIHEIVQG